MNVSTKLIATGAASVLGVALAVGGAQAASGSSTAHDAPGHVVQVSGVVPVSAQATTTATVHATPNVKGRMPGAPVAHATTYTTMHSVRQVAWPAAQLQPAYRAYRSDCGWDYGRTGMSGSRWHMR